MPVIIGIDPHKATHTAVAVNGSEDELSSLRVRATRAQVDKLLTWAAPFASRTWAIEGAEVSGFCSRNNSSLLAKLCRRSCDSRCADARAGVRKVERRRFRARWLGTAGWSGRRSVLRSWPNDSSSVLSPRGLVRSRASSPPSARASPSRADAAADRRIQCTRGGGNVHAGGTCNISETGRRLHLRRYRLYRRSPMAMPGISPARMN
jgi:hypothetical protein